MITDDEIKGFQCIEARKKEIVYLRYVLDSFDSSFFPDYLKCDFNYVRNDLVNMLDRLIYFYRRVQPYDKSLNYEQD